MRAPSSRTVVLGLGLAILGAGWIAWSRSPFASAGTAVEEEVKALRAQGVSTTPQELRRWLAKPGRNAGPTYQLAFANVRLLPQKPLNLVTAMLRTAPDVGLSLSQVKAAKPVLASMEPIFATLETGSRGDYLDYGRHWEDGVFLLLPELSAQRRLAGLAAMAGYVKVRQGDFEGGRRLLTVAARMTRHLGDDPVFFGAVVHAGMEAMVLKFAMRAIESQPGSARAFSIGKEVLAELGPPVDLRRVIPGEVVVAHRLTAESDRRGIEEWYRDMGLRPDQTSGSDLTLLRLRSVRLANEANYLKFWRKYLEALPKDPEDIDAVDSAAASAARVMETAPATSTLLFSSVGGMYPREHTELRTALACRRLLDNAIARAEGGAPTTKGIDPFSGSSFKTKAAGKGFLLYSVGNDRNDDGGDLSLSSREGESKDLGVRVELVRYKTRR